MSGNVLTRETFEVGARPWLEDHRPGGSRIVPGAVIAAWILEAPWSERNESPGLRDLRWRRPFRIPDHVRSTSYSVCAERHPRTNAVVAVELRAPRIDSERGVVGETRVATARPGSAGEFPAAPAPLGKSIREEMRSLHRFQGPAFHSRVGPVRFVDHGLDAELRFEAPPPPELPRLGEGCRLDARHLDGLFQAAGTFLDLSGLERGVPAVAEVLDVYRGAVAADTLQVRVRRNEDGSLRVWCGDASGRTAIEMNGYRTAPAGFVSAARPEDGNGPDAG